MIIWCSGERSCGFSNLLPHEEIVFTVLCKGCCIRQVPEERTGGGGRTEGADIRLKMTSFIALWFDDAYQKTFRVRVHVSRSLLQHF